MAQAKTQTKDFSPVLSRGQKAAATRKANQEKAAKAHAEKVKAVKISTRAKVPTAKERAKNLATLVREQKARDARKQALAAERHAVKAGKEKAITDQRTKSLIDIRKAAQGKLHDLRFAAVDGATKGKRTGYAYAGALNASFTPDWPNFKKEQANKQTNHGIMVTAFFAEKDSYFAAFNANHDGVGKANPSAYWANLKKYAQTLMADGIEKKRGSGTTLAAREALRRDIPALYLRANNDKAFDSDEKLQVVATKLGEVCALLGLNLGEINKKIGK